jgi:hypothetical protein
MPSGGFEMTGDPKSLKEAIEKGREEGPAPVGPRVLAALGFIFILFVALIFEWWLVMGREFLIVITLWIALLVAAKHHNKFPKDKNK